MKNKNNIRAQRNQKAENRREGFRKEDKQRQETLKRELSTVEEAKQPIITYSERDLNPVREKKLSAVKKTSSKAAGLKSVFVLDENRLLMTSFGRGNDAVPEKEVVGGDIRTIAEKPAFSVRHEDDIRFLIDGRVPGAQTDNPLHAADPAATKSHRDDLIHARSALENRFFGRTFDDNIHIQIAYSILDIEKLLTFHVNNILYTVINFLRTEGEDVDDFISYLTKYKTYDKLRDSDKGEAKEIMEYFDRLCKAPQLGYMNLEILRENGDGNGKSGKKAKDDPNTIKLSREEFFNVLYILGTLRQVLAHGEEIKSLYRREGIGEQYDRVLSRLYKERIDKLNGAFLSTAAKNLAILFKAFGVSSADEKAEYVRDYYNFTVRHTYKNQGFSIKQIREHFSCDIPEAFVLRDKKYDSTRGKLNPFVDFAIFRYYKARPDEAQNLISELRASFSEVDKDKIYGREARRVWPSLKNTIISHILPNMTGDAIKKIVPDSDVNPDMLKGSLISSDAACFSRLVYLMTLFINGKEINDLLTTLIHSFENIASFIEVLRSESIPVGFKNQYWLFAERCSAVSEELRAINSFARMSKPAAFAKGIMVIEALKVLGMKCDEQALKDTAKLLLDPATKKTDPQKAGLRNFIANNVIESDRFKYLVRYGNVNKLKGIASNRAVVSFVLKEIPDSQIIRYINSIYGLQEESIHPDMREGLADRLTGFSFEDIENVVQNDLKACFEEQEEKRRKQALVRLYLTVLYLIVKNLVYINSRYFLAFHCVERDWLLLMGKAAKDEQYSGLAKWFIDEYPMNKRAALYIRQNMLNSDDYTVKVFRNKTEHLDTVRNADMYLGEIRSFDSWFDLYHYITQRRIMDQFEYECGKPSNRPEGGMAASAADLNPKTVEYFEKVRRYRTCCKDFIKALCVPFAYNLPRYKNLCIGELFDRNNALPKGTGINEEVKESGK